MTRRPDMVKHDNRSLGRMTFQHVGHLTVGRVGRTAYACVEHPRLSKLVEVDLGPDFEEHGVADCLEDAVVETWHVDGVPVASLAEAAKLLGNPSSRPTNGDRS